LDNNAIVIADTAGVIRFWSNRAQSAFGHSAQDAVGRTLDLIVPHEFRVAHWAGFHRAISAGSAAAEGQPNLFPVLDANGLVKQAPGKLTLLRAGDGAVIGCMVVFG
jgi:PAS domain S-box-containing protein